MLAAAEINLLARVYQKENCKVGSPAGPGQTQKPNLGLDRQAKRGPEVEAMESSHLHGAPCLTIARQLKVHARSSPLSWIDERHSRSAKREGLLSLSSLSIRQTFIALLRQYQLRCRIYKVNNTPCNFPATLGYSKLE